MAITINDFGTKNGASPVSRKVETQEKREKLTTITTTMSDGTVDVQTRQFNTTKENTVVNPILAEKASQAADEIVESVAEPMEKAADVVSTFMKHMTQIVTDFNDCINAYYSIMDGFDTMMADFEQARELMRKSGLRRLIVPCTFAGKDNRLHDINFTLTDSTTSIKCKSSILGSGKWTALENWEQQSYGEIKAMERQLYPDMTQLPVDIAASGWCESHHRIYFCEVLENKLKDLYKEKTAQLGIPMAELEELHPDVRQRIARTICDMEVYVGKENRTANAS